MEAKIKSNLVFLCKNLINYEIVLVYLVQHGIFSHHEEEQVESETTDFTKNKKILTIILKKDAHYMNEFIEILRKTGNEHCADEVDDKILEDTGNGPLCTFIKETAKQEGLLQLTSPEDSSKIVSEDGLREEEFEKEDMTERIAVEEEPSHLLGTVTEEKMTLEQPKPTKICEAELQEKCSIENVHVSGGEGGKLEGEYEPPEKKSRKQEKTEGIAEAQGISSIHPKTTLINLNTPKQCIENVLVAGGGIGVQNHYHFTKDEILRKTNYEHCADEVEGMLHRRNKTTHLHPRLPKNKWWQEKKILIESLYERKHEDQFLVDVLHRLLQNDKNRMAVIVESKQASKLTGMGGIGKTLTAKWLANKYEHIYDHILWIDCGEDSLLKSFQKLAVKLNIENRKELTEVEEFSRECFECLTDFKCLWIFDNTENYKERNGIKKILPKDEKNFYCLITSRSLDWGTKNIGYGQISKLELDIFSDEECLHFFNNFLEIKGTREQVKKLCKLLGNLPLALQLAATALNNNKIDLDEYITKTSQLESIVDEEFDDYEKSINKSVSITLKLIPNENYGQTALNILTTFAYIRPDDIQSEFFIEVTNIKLEELHWAIKLLEKYFLITKSEKVKEEGESKGQLIVSDSSKKGEIKQSKKITSLSIHRLLQQVIRYNTSTTEKETLRKILGCHGFLDYKLIPFTKYADEAMQMEFPNVKAQLVDQEQLKRLLKEERFDESAPLAQLINKELKTKTTAFNYSVCLDKNKQFKEAVGVLVELCKEHLEENIYIRYDYSQFGILNLKSRVYNQLIDGHLLSIYWRNFIAQGNLKKLKNSQEKVKEILKKGKYFACLHSDESQGAFLQIVSSNLIPVNYSLQCGNRNIDHTIKLQLVGEKKRIYLVKVAVDLNIALPEDLQELELEAVHFKDSITEKKADLSGWIPQKLNQLTIRNSQCILPLEKLSSIKFLTLWGCSLNLDSVHPISPIELQLSDVSFVKEGQELRNVSVNEFIHFNQIKRMKLGSPDYRKMTINMSQDSIQLDYLHLEGVTILDYKDAKWIINYLQLVRHPFVNTTRMSIREIEIVDSQWDIFYLPPTIEKLILWSSTVKCSGKLDLPRLTLLQLMGVESTSFLSHVTSGELTRIFLSKIQELHVDLVPSTVKLIKISEGISTVIGGVRKVDKLIVLGLPFDDMEQILNLLQPSQLVIDTYYFNYSPDQVMKLINKEINTVAISIGWSEDSFHESTLSQLVNRYSQCYLFEGRNGKAIEWEQFDEMVNEIDVCEVITKTKI